MRDEVRDLWGVDASRCDLAAEGAELEL
jgi:hypothetical protein